MLLATSVTATSALKLKHETDTVNLALRLYPGITDRIQPGQINSRTAEFTCLYSLRLEAI